MYLLYLRLKGKVKPEKEAEGAHWHIICYNLGMQKVKMMVIILTYMGY